MLIASHTGNRIGHAQGGITAVVRTRIANDEGRAVLECVTSHARQGPKS